LLSPVQLNFMVALSLSTPQSQTFDTLPISGSTTWNNDLTISGWYTARSGTGTTIVADTGSGTAGNLYSYGLTGSSDRALGSIGSGGATAGNFAWGVRLVNDTANPITSLNLNYTGEQWRNSAATGSQAVTVEYRIGGTTFDTLATGWTAASGLSFSSPIIGGTAGALNGNLAADRVVVSGTISGFTLAPNQEIWIRWNDPDHTGSDHGLAIDDVTISAGAPPATVVSVAATANASETGPANGSFRFSRTGDTASDLTIAYTVANGTGQATGGTDYTPTLPGTITIPAGSAFVDLVITPIDDTLPETTETVTLTLAPGSYGVSGSASTATVSILDNDAAAPTITKISAIQGTGATAALTGTRTIEGVVVSLTPGLNGFYVEEEDADFDTDSNTSEGIFVYDPSALFSGAIGTKVRITGNVNEFTSTGDGNTSSLTQITLAANTDLVPLGNAPLPTTANVVLPVTNAADLERYEGMLVNISGAGGTLTVTNNFTLGRYGQVTLSAGGRIDQYTQVNAPSVAGNAAYQQQVAAKQIILDDGSGAQNPATVIYGRGGNPLSAANTLRGGDTVAIVTGVLDHRFEGYRIQSTTPVNFTPANAREATPSSVGGTLKVASFNVLNYFTDLDTNAVINIPNGVSFEPRGANTATEFTRQRDKIISAITSMNVDVIGIMEMENNGPTAIQNLVNGLNAVAGAGTYAFISDTTLVNDPNPAVNAVGTDAIKVGILYKPGKVTPVGAVLSYAEPNAASPIFSRPPIAQTFADASGNKFSIIVNHFKSKSPTGATGADLDQADGQGAYNAKRVAQSNALLGFINTVKTTSGDNDVLVIGDLNAYAQEDPITTLTSGGLTNLFGNSSYSYQFDGQWGSLDHALASATLTSQVTGVTKWHINSDEPISLDYNTEFKSTAQQSSFYSSDAYRSSDHDPLVIGLNLSSSTPASSNPRDFGGDGKADILFRNTNGTVALWQMNGATLNQANTVTTIDASWQVAAIADFGGDGKADILWRNTNGTVALWQMNGAALSQSDTITAIDASWQVAGVADFSGDGKADILWRNTDGTVALWQMNGATRTQADTITNVGASWQVAGVADFSGDSRADILWRNTDGTVALWQMNGATRTQADTITNIDASWQIAGVNDFGGDGKADILWRNTNGTVALWQMNGATRTQADTLTNVDASWQVAEIADFGGDSKADILWRNTNGTVALWQMNGASLSQANTVTSIDASWQVV
jgi:uncharacterized protein